MGKGNLAMKKQIITVLVLGAIAAMPFSAVVSAADGTQWRKYTTRAKLRASEEAAAKEEKAKEAALARQKAEEALSREPLWKRYTSRGKAARKALTEKGLTSKTLGASTVEADTAKKAVQPEASVQPMTGKKEAAAAPSKKMDGAQKAANPIAAKADAKLAAEQDEPSWKKYLRRAEEKNKTAQESAEEVAKPSPEGNKLSTLEEESLPTVPSDKEAAWELAAVNSRYEVYFDSRSLSYDKQTGILTVWNKWVRRGGNTTYLYSRYDVRLKTYMDLYRADYSRRQGSMISESTVRDSAWTPLSPHTLGMELSQALNAYLLNQ